MLAGFLRGAIDITIMLIAIASDGYSPLLSYIARASLCLAILFGIVRLDLLPG